MEMIQGAKSNVVNSYVVSYTKEDEKGNQLKPKAYYLLRLQAVKIRVTLYHLILCCLQLSSLLKPSPPHTSPTILIVIIIIILIIILSALVNFHLFDLQAINIRKL